MRTACQRVGAAASSAGLVQPWPAHIDGTDTGNGTPRLMSPRPIDLPPPSRPGPPLTRGPIAFLWHYIRARPGGFLAMALLALAAAGCAVTVQYAMKLIVDAMAAGDHPAVWWSLGAFLVLIAGENVLWRVGGWKACHLIVDTGVRIRLDLFNHLCGHAAEYFTRNLAGALGGRLTGTAGAFGGIATAVVWKIAPPLVDFIGAVLIFATIDGPTAAALVAAAGVAALAVGRFGGQGKPLHMPLQRRRTGSAAT
jgi:ATP-binding cassette subfamily B protein